MKRIAIILGSLGLAALLGGLVIVSSPRISNAAFHYMVLLKNEYTVKNTVVRGHDGWLFFEPDLQYILDPLPEVNVERISEFSDMLRRKGIALFVLPIPSKIEVYPEKFTALPAPHPVKQGRDRLIRQIRDAGVRVIDVLPAFERAKVDCQVFEAYDSHWTPYGIELAARVVGEQIDSALHAYRIPRRATYSVRDTAFLTRGDVLGKFAREEKDAWYRIPVRQVLDGRGRLYADDRKSRIMILGDSFVDRGRWWHAHLGAHLARSIGYPTRTLFSLRANGDGPCMYATRKRAFPKNGIVIWAFTSRVLRYPLCDPEEASARAL